MKVGGTWLFWRVKRLADVCLSVVLLPLLLVIGCLVWCLNLRLNPGPLIFDQERVGLHGQPFVMFKFRTMHPGSSGPRFADTESYRISGFGHLLSRYRIDELPQLLNVLKGDMSLIGPRPEQSEFAQRYRHTFSDYVLRHSVRPGLSGLSQVLQGYTCDNQGTRRKLALDLAYIRRSGFRMEAFVFWRTVRTVATGFGAALTIINVINQIPHLRWLTNCNCRTTGGERCARRFY